METMKLHVFVFLSSSLILLSQASGEYPTISGSIRSMDETSGILYEPHSLERSRYADDDITSFIIVLSSAIMKMSKGVAEPPHYDNKRVSHLAGHSVFTGYVDGNGRDARFSHISDFTQSEDGRLIYISDQDNHCIRLYDRLEDDASVFAGNCTHPGSHTGPRETARFSSPAGIVMSPSWNEIYIADRLNNRILRIDLSTKENYVQTVVDDSYDVSLRVVLPVAIRMSGDGENLYVSSENGLFGYRNFSMDQQPIISAITHDITKILDFVLIENDQQIAAADFQGNRLIFFDLVNGGEGYFCTGRLSESYLSTDGPSTSCEINTPQGIAVIDGTHLYITEYTTEKIREVTFQVQELTTTTTEAPPTTTTVSTKSTQPIKTLKFTTPVPTTAKRSQIFDSSDVERTTPKENVHVNPLIIGLSVGITIPTILIGLLVGFVLYLKRQSLKEAEAMWARRTAQGGYSGPGFHDENFHAALQRNSVSEQMPSPQHHHSYSHSQAASTSSLPGYSYT